MQCYSVRCVLNISTLNCRKLLNLFMQRTELYLTTQQVVKSFYTVPHTVLNKYRKL